MFLHYMKDSVTNQKEAVIMFKEIDVTEKPSQDQIKMLNNASLFSVSDNDEYPELSEEELLGLKKVANRYEDENDR